MLLLLLFLEGAIRITGDVGRIHLYCVKAAPLKTLEGRIVPEGAVGVGDVVTCVRAAGFIFPVGAAEKIERDACDIFGSAVSRRRWQRS